MTMIRNLGGVTGRQDIPPKKRPRRRGGEKNTTQASLAQPSISRQASCVLFLCFLYWRRNGNVAQTRSDKKRPLLLLFRMIVYSYLFYLFFRKYPTSPPSPFFYGLVSQAKKKEKKGMSIPQGNDGRSGFTLGKRVEIVLYIVDCLLFSFSFLSTGHIVPSLALPRRVGGGGGGGGRGRWPWGRFKGSNLFIVLFLGTLSAYTVGGAIGRVI
ncbi:hypothetical protein LZ30DRAFT_199826 [Colletotrichum cereale]|nr:hypothetical protein LZ30DRAFT_199826 [Colletotrichum cereale]